MNEATRAKIKALAIELRDETRPWNEIIDDLEALLGSGAWPIEAHDLVNQITA